MRIAIVLASDFTEGNGANARIKALAKGLKQHGFKVDLLFLHASSFNHTHINIKNQGFWEGIYFKFLNGNCIRPRTVFGKVIDSIRAVAGSTRFLLGHHREYDLVYLYEPTLHQFFHIHMLNRLLGKKVIIERTELRSSFTMKSRNLWERMLKALHRIDERNLHRFCSHLFVISDSLYDHYRQYFPEHRISLFPIVVDPSRFMHLNGRRKTHHRIGYIGSFGDKDGVRGIIRAYDGARKHKPDLKLRLIGFNGEDRQITEMPEVKKLNGSIEWMGQVRYEQVPDYLYECDLLIVNRDRSPYARYGFPTKLGEYLATGRPTVVTNVGDVGKYLTHGTDAIVVEPENESALTRSILDRYREQERYIAIGKRGKEVCMRHFDYMKHMDTIIKTFRKVIQR